VSALERDAVQHLIDKATAAGVPVPAEIAGLVERLDHGSSYPARAWAEAHPDEDQVPCCMGSIHDPEGCTCWTPVYDTDQATPRPPTSAGDLQVQAAMCGDCAYRPGSPERADQWLADELYALPAQGKAFYCHDGMRRPAYWQHPDGRRVDGAPDDWQPPMRGGIPYRADGSPGLLCAGWMARRMQARRSAGASP
jgi:hypothetical protein